MSLVSGGEAYRTRGFNCSGNMRVWNMEYRAIVCIPHGYSQHRNEDHLFDATYIPQPSPAKPHATNALLQRPSHTAA
jgi:hypothetical protein